MKWHKRFLDLAENISAWSKDPSTKVGAVIIGQDRKPLSYGYNGPPRRVNDDIADRYERPQKYFYWEHAERNAIYNADIPLNGAILYTTHYPCAACARAIIQKRIKIVVTWENSSLGNWVDSHKAAVEMFQEAGVELIFLSR